MKELIVGGLLQERSVLSQESNNKVKIFQAISLLKSAKGRACLYSALGVLATSCYLDYKLQLDTMLECGAVVSFAVS